jgi:hypothetical protein
MDHDSGVDGADDPNKLCLSKQTELIQTDAAYPNKLSSG